MKEKPAPFTAAEIEIVLNNSTAEAHRLLPHRTKQTISTKRYHLKDPEYKNKERAGRWTADEIALLKKHYASTENRDIKSRFLPHRGLIEITYKARNLKLRKQYEPPIEFQGSKAIVEQIRAFSMSKGLPVIQLDKLLGTDRYFQSAWRNRSVNLGAVSRALDLLGGQFRAVFVETVDIGHLAKKIDQFSQPLPPIPKQKGKQKKPRAAATTRLVGKAKDSPAIIKAVDAIVPRGLPDRDDIKQSLLLALHDGTLSPEQLSDRKRVGAIITAVRKDNSEQGGYAVSFDAVRDDGRTLHDLIAGASPEADAQDAA